MVLPGSGDWVGPLSSSLRTHERERGEVRTSLPRYEIVEEIKRGGMGVVYRAWDPQLGREVALKVLLEDSDAEARRRFLREAQLAAQLHHPNIVPVYDTGECMGQVYLAMLLIDGATLDKAGLDLRGSMAAVRDAARAIDFAHQKSVVHRDIKPSNVMVDRQGRVYVTDFGLARKTDAAAKLTLTGVVLGTPAYMAPEQAQGQGADSRSDVYSLGATLYELSTGQPPFSGPDPVAILLDTALKEPPPPRSRRPGLPRDVETIVLKAMERDPARRYATAGAMAEDLQRCLDGEPILARPPGVARRARRFLARHRWLLPAGSVAAAAALAFWLFAPAPDPEVERVGAHIVALEFDSARDLLGKLERERPGDPRVEALAKQFREAVDRELQRDLKELALALGNDGPAAALVEKMRRLAMDHPRTLQASDLLQDFRRVRDEYDRRRQSFDELLQKNDWEGAWGEVLKLGDLPVKGLAALGLPAEFPGAREEAKGRRERLSTRLQDKILGESTPPQIVADCLGLLKVVDPAEHKATSDSLGRKEIRLKAQKHSDDVADFCLDGYLDAARISLRRLEELPSPPPELVQRARDHVSSLQVLERDAEEGIEELLHSLTRDQLDPLLLERLRGSRPTSELLSFLSSQLEYQVSFFEALRGLDRLAEEGDAGRIRKALEGLTDERFRGITRRDGRVADRLLRVGRARLGTGDAAGAEEWLGKGVKLAPGNWEILEERGVARRELAEPEAAEADWKAAKARIDEVPQIGRTPELLLGRARLLRRLGDPKGALGAARDLPKTAERELFLAQLGYLAEQYDEARTALENAGRLGADTGRLSYWLGLCRAKGDPEQALARFRESALPDAHYQRAALHVDLRQGSPAVTAADEALSRAGGLTDEEAMGHFRGDLNRPRRENVRLFKRDAHYVRASGQYELQAFLKCVDDASESLRVGGEHTEALLLRGMAQFRLGQYEKARSDAARVIELCRELPGAQHAARAGRASELKAACEQKLKTP